MLEEIRALGFEYAELGHGIRLSLVDGIQKAVAGGVIKISSLHNFCPLPVGFMHASPDCYMPSSRREAERLLAVRHTLRTIDFAASLGAKFVVLHLGTVSMRNYTDKLIDLYAKEKADTPRFFRKRDKALRVRDRKREPYLEQVFRTLDVIAPRAREAGIRLGVETRMDIEQIPDFDETAEIITRYGADAVAYWHDIGHAQIKENLGLTTHEFLLRRFKDQTAGMHLQDFAPPVYDHQPPGYGSFDFGRLAPFVTDKMVLAWEINPEWKTEEIVDTVKHVHDKLRRPATS